MTEVDIIATLHHYIDECGWEWPITSKVVSRLYNTRYTVKELKEIYAKDAEAAQTTEAIEAIEATEYTETSEALTYKEETP